MRPDDLRHLVTPADPRWHPDGRRLAFVVTRVDLDEDRYARRLHLWDGEVDRQLTGGPADHHPRWSPDGATLAFLRTPDQEGASAQLALLPADGGEARLVTELPRGVAGFAWSPAGDRLVLVGDAWVAELADLDDEERRRRPRRITRLPYRVETEGWVHQRRRQLWLLDRLDEEQPRLRPLTDLRDDVVAPVWTPEGDAVLAVTRARSLPDTEPHQQLIRVPVGDGPNAGALGPEEVRWGPTGAWSWVGVDQRGRTLAAGLADPLSWPDVSRVHEVVGAFEEAELRDLTGHLDRDVLPGSPALSPAGPRPVPGGFVTGLEDRGATRLVLVADVDAGPPTTTDLVGGDRCVTGVDVHPDGTTLAFCWTDPSTPGELTVLRGGEEVTVTAFAAPFRAAVTLAPTERWTFARDEVELDAWSVLPARFADAGAGSVPVLINIHGGPTAQYGDHFFDEFQVEAGAGYLVVGTNPRGASGRGVEWARAVVGAWTDPTSVDHRDLAAIADAVLTRYPQADPQRIGVMGGSYGGYAVARLLAEDDRYASAIVERGLLEWGSFAGTSDIGAFFDRMFLGASIVDGPGPHHAASPLWRAGDVRTPTLVLHSDADWRCPVEQAERYFAALLAAGVETEFVRFPDEGHELSRAGTPRHRVERFEVILDWHDRHLG